jgi:hypothetical protein
MYGAPFIDDTATAVAPAPQDAAPPPQDAGTPPANQAQQAAPTDQPAPTDTVPVIEIPAGIAELREQDGPRHLFTPQKTYAESIPDAMFDSVVELPQPVRTAVVNELREISADLGLSVSDVANVRTRAAYLHKNPQDPGEQRREAVRQLQSAFGNADRALQDARALVTRDPRVGRLIHTMGLGNDPETLVMLTYAARRQRNAGRL